MPRGNEQDSRSSSPIVPEGCLCRRDAWAALYRKHYQSLVDSLSRIGGVSREDCEDAAQQAFLELWRHGSYEHQGDVATASYLLRAAHSRLLDHLRKKVTQRQHIRDAAPSDEEAVDPIAAFWSHETEQQVRWAVSQLPPAQREVVEWMDLEGLPATGLAQKLGCNTETLRSRHRRAKANLFKVLHGNEGGGEKPPAKKY